jgi:hypothetical protein
VKRPHTGRPPAPLPGGQLAKQRAAVVLAVLSGDCPIDEASRRLGISPTRYYALERQALEGLLHALDEPLVKRRMAAICREQVQLEHEVLRLQALVRATQKAVALPPPPKRTGRRRKIPPRARKVIAQLRMPTATEATATSPEQE